MPPKQLPMKLATCKCKYNCHDLTENAVRRLHNDFWKQNEDCQGNFLFGLVNIVQIKQRRLRKTDDPALSRRQISVTYCLPSDNGHVQVCGKTFRDILGLSQKRIYTLIEKKKKGEVCFSNQRGKNPRSHFHKMKYTEEDRQLIKNHISYFPTEESHYSRHKSSKLYLSPDLNIHRMYRAFVKAYPDTLINHRFYRRCFRKSFPKLSFHCLRTDTCSLCDLYKNKINLATGPEKLKLISKKELHLRKAEKAVKLLHENNASSRMPSSDTCTINMDMQQVIFTPTLTHSSMFYSRQLSNYNLCIHVGDTSTSFMCLWHEGIAGRGGNEVASSLLKVITSNATAKRNLTVWCDNCAGQNKNRMVLMILIYAVVKNVLDCIDLKFLVSGHSYMPCDRDFGIIEKRKRVSKPMVPEEVAEMIREAKHVQPFNVVMMKEEDFYDISVLCDKFLNTSPIKISSASWIKISKATLPNIQIRTSFNSMEPWKEYNIFKRGKSVNDISRIHSLLSLGRRSAISAPKQKDLLSMLDFMDTKYHDFYRQVCT